MLLFNMILIASGCWDRYEITDVAQVWIIGVDRLPEMEGYILTLQIISPSEASNTITGGGGGTDPMEKAVWVTTAQCKSISDAVGVVSQLSPRKLAFDYPRAIVFGEEIAREGIGPILDYFQREHRFRRTMRIFIAKGTTAQAVLEANPRLEKSPSVAMINILRWSEKAGNTLSVNLGDFLLALNREGMDPVANMVVIHDNSEVVEAERIIPKNKQPEERGLGIKRDSLELRMAGNAIFADDKLVDWLDVEETKGYMLAVNKAKPGIIDTEHEEVNKKMAFQNLSSKSKIIPQISDDGRLSFLIKAKIRANLVEQMDNLRLDKEEVQKSLEDLLAATVKDAVRKAVEKAQKNKTDIFGMGVELYRTYPKLWKEKYKDNWSEIFARVPVEIQVEAKINNIGVILETLERKGLVE